MQQGFPADGGCTCRAVRYRMMTHPMFVHCCHCSWCQRETGASFALNALIEAERVAEEWVSRGLPLVIVNPAAPVGDLDIKPTATGQMILDFLEGRMGAYVDTGLNLIDVRDAAWGHVLAAERGRVGEKYILGCENLSLKQILDRLSAISGLPAPRVRLPHWVPLSVAALDTTFARLTRRAPRISLDAVKLSRHHMYFDSGKARAELGYTSRPAREALARALRWFEEHGMVPAPAGRSA